MSKISGAVDVSGDIQVNGMVRYSVFTHSNSSSEDIYLDKVHTINATHSVRILLPDLTLPTYHGITYSISKNTTEPIHLATQSNNTIYYDGEYKEMIIRGGTNVLSVMNINGQWSLTASNIIPVSSPDSNKNMIMMGMGEHHTIGVSHDGENIKLMGKSVFDTAGHGVTHNTHGLWVGHGCGINTLAYTTDNGVTWVPLGNTVFSRNCYDVSYDTSTGMWVAVGEGVNSLAYSHDGITWIGLGTSIFQTYGIGVSSRNGMWVACGKGGNTVAYSTNGKTWVGLGTVLTTCARCVGNEDGVWFVTGEGDTALKWSMDRITWTEQRPGVTPPSSSIPLDSLLQSVSCMTYGIDKWVAVGVGDSHTMAYSTDGVSWVGLGKSLFSIKGNTVYYSYIHFTWYAFGEGMNTSIQSHDGVTWTHHSNIFNMAGFSMSTRCQHQSIPGGVYVAVGKGDHTICCSMDGGSTYNGMGKEVFTSQGFSLHKHDGMWVAVGEGQNTLAYSYHGCIWKGLGESTFTIRGRCVTHFKNKWVAVGQGTNTIAYSSDGIVWNPLGMSIITNTGLYVSSNDTICVAVGIGVNKIAYSTNGIEWYPVSNTFDSYGSFVYYDTTSNTWYAFGDDNVVFTSSNGIQWTRASFQLPQDVCMLNTDLSSGETQYLKNNQWADFQF